MKIKSYQSGGIVYLPTSNRTEAPAQSSAGTSDSSTKSKVPTFAKEIIGLVKDKGLDNDVSAMLGQVENLLNAAADPTGQSLDMYDLLKVVRMSANVKADYDRYGKAMESLEKEDAYSEVATDRRGQIYVQDTNGKISTVSHSEFAENRDKYMALTNADLLNQRRYNPDFTYKTNVLDDLANSVGMGSVVEYAKNLIKEFKPTSLTGYGEKQANKIREGLAHIVAGDIGNFDSLVAGGPEGLYKIKQESTIADTGINEALNYLVSTMPTAYKHTLAAKATVEGFKPEAMLMTMIYANTGREVTADYDNTTSKAAGYAGDSAGDHTKWDKSNIAIEFARGELTEKGAFISPNAETKTDTAQMLFHSWNGGVPVTMDRKPIYNDKNLADIIRNTGQFMGFSKSDISFGNQQITMDQLKTMVWDDQNVSRVELPAKIENGRVMPDFGLIDQLNACLKQIHDNPNMTSIQKNELIKKCEREGVTWNEEKQSFDVTKTEIFAMISAYASDDLIDIEKSSENYVDKVSRDQGKLLKDRFLNIVKFNTLNPTKKTKAALDKSVGVGSFVHGNVYMWLADDMQAMNLTKDPYVEKQMFVNPNERYLVGQQIAQGAQQSTYQTQMK